MLVWIRVVPYVHGTVQSLVPTKALLVRLEQNEVVCFPFCADCVVFVRLIWMEVENENEITFFVNDNFVTFIRKGHILVGLDH